MDKKKLQKIYTEHHREGERLGFVFGGAERVKYFAEWIGSGKVVLDIGCRDGATTRAYREGNEVIGVDVDKEALRICREELGIKTEWVDVNEGLPFEDSFFDVVVAGEIIEHVFFPRFFLQEIERVLKPSGVFIGSTPNAFRLKNRLTFLLGKDFEIDETHLHHFSYHTLHSLLAVFFNDIEIIPISSRFLKICPKLFANDLVFRCAGSK